jgi:RNA polymerase sigma factor (sigma-70 family)
MDFEDQNNLQWYQDHVQPHEERVKHWIKSRYGSYCDADDVLQEALLRLFRSKQQGEITSVRAYLFALARNVAVDVIRKSKVHVTRSIEEESLLDIVEEQTSVHEIAARNHELEILTMAIQALPERCRQVFTLSRVYGMSYKHIARELGISVHTVSAQITIGLSKCTEFIERYEKRRGI